MQNSKKLINCSHEPHGAKTAQKKQTKKPKKMSIKYLKNILNVELEEAEIKSLCGFH